MCCWRVSREGRIFVRCSLVRHLSSVSLPCTLPVYPIVAAFRLPSPHARTPVLILTLYLSQQEWTPPSPSSAANCRPECSGWQSALIRPRACLRVRTRRGLVCEKPFPCMPVGFWLLAGFGANDDEFRGAQDRFMDEYFPKMPVGDGGRRARRVFGASPTSFTLLQVAMGLTRWVDCWDPDCRSWRSCRYHKVEDG